MRLTFTTHPASHSMAASIVPDVQRRPNQGWPRVDSPDTWCARMGNRQVLGNRKYNVFNPKHHFNTAL